MADKGGWGRRHTDPLVVLGFVFSLLALGVTIVVSFTVLNNRSDLLDQKAGRKIGVVAACAVSRSVINAGADTIRASIVLPGDRIVHGKLVLGPLSKALPGYPATLSERQQIANLQAKRYRAHILHDVIAQSQDAGVRPPPVNKKTGDLDCKAFAKAAKASK